MQEICLYLCIFFGIEFEELVLGEAIRDGYMAVAFGVDTLHLAAEKTTVSGSVAELVNGDVIMDHLMEDGIFDKVFGQVDTGIDTQDEVFVTGRAEEPGAMFGEGEFAKESAGMGELDGDGRQGTAEKTGIELTKTGLDVGDGGNHL